MKPGAKALPISLNKKEFTRKSPRKEREKSEYGLAASAS
jgi:hypothetical protein